ncbi:exodeoxyribonuclease VII large subunit [Nesterenkonia sp. AN1]|uniref:Exodeoxyribonuclease 7 large subunit n=1 Tax=Nesterenkonia aurantiaca TaxID=1436010 RepID=A0A4R7G5P3_9MICC|nr:MULTISPECIES: exodeoxyribonuclease VII large subunit [Nesterenkonia]EXF24148.1 exodeoxyribonuclease VII large subunit [Nesterenkonia sp. AN1]TDS86560.1 exodeoxyribonuclease VII large subunit [Nesterenkonia aurantiaca]
MSEPAQAQDTSAETPWALSTYSGKLKAHIEAAPPTWVEGQLVEFNLRNGNAWMTLRDLEQEVSFSTVAWRGVAGSLNGTVQPGSRVVALVKPNLYEKSGRLSLVAQQMKPVGLGDLLARIEQLKQRLAAEGLFRVDRKQPLPVLPLRIGLITGRNSDALKDILRNTHARWAAAQFEIREVATQGPSAPAEVTAALTELDADPAVEVIVIARGGGALEEVVLPFSDERLIRAVAAAHTPVVSAIGHEADRPLLDEVADMRASTPTGAAKLLVPDEAQEREALTHARARMSAGVERLIGRESEWLTTLRSRPVLAQPQDMITGRAQELLMLRRRALFGMETAVRRGTDWVAQTRARVRSLSPQSTLDRGYAVVQTRGQAGWDVLRDAGTVAIGDQLSIMVASGELTARAEEIYPKDRRSAPAEPGTQTEESARTPKTAQTAQTQN